MSAEVKSHFRLGLIGPDTSQPCGIADYTARLAAAFLTKAEKDSHFQFVFVPIQKVFLDDRINSEIQKCDAVLVQYERSLYPNANHFLKRFSQFCSAPIFMVPHEVYETDPFAFPYEKLSSKFPPLLWLKQIRYRWKHGDFFAEKKLQHQSYFAQAVIPLSGPGFDILQRQLLPKKILAPIPLAYFKPVDKSGESIKHKITPISLFNPLIKKVIGIFGFLNPSFDYELVFEILKHQGEEIALLMIGGSRTENFSVGQLETVIANHGLQNRVKITGFIPEAELSAYFSICNFFISPLQFKSNTSSILNLLYLQKVIVTSDLPICRFLKAEGAPLELYSSSGEFEKKIKAVLTGEILPLPNQYPWSFEAVANAYLKVISTAVKAALVVKRKSQG